MKETRIKRVLEKLEAMGLEQMLITDAISILYLTDIWVDAGERLVALYLNKKGNHCLFVNHMFTLPAEPGVEVVRFSDTDPYMEMVGARLERGKVLGVDKEIYQSLGADDLSFPPSVCFGANGAVGHYRCGDVALKPGDCVLLDVGCIKDHYCADMTRTFFFGKVEKEEYRRVYELVLAANRAAEAVIRPGVRFCDIDQAARSIIEEAGYGSCFTHRLGHFIGMEVHDYGDVSGANQECAQAGQIFSIEPGIYLEGEMGVRIEDLVLVTEDGCEILNSYSKELEILQ